MTWARHDLMELHGTALAENGAGDIAAWVAAARPVIVRRRSVGDPAGHVPVAIPFPVSHHRRRVAFTVPASAVARRRAPVSLHGAAKTLPPAWRNTAARLGALGREVAVHPFVFGSALWQHLTALPYLTPASDLDLLWRVTDATAVRRLLEGLAAVERDAPMRLDGEIVFPDGSGVSWRELHAGHDPVLAKTVEQLALRPNPVHRMPAGPVA